MKTTGAPPQTTVDRLLEQVSDLETMIRRESEDAERNRRLSSDVTNALRDIGCFRMFRPRSRGGLEFDPVSALRVMEELARIDTAVGWDGGIATGNVVGLHYDPLLGKLIAWGATRTEAIARMRRALDELMIVGVATSQPFHTRVLAEETYNPP